MTTQNELVDKILEVSEYIHKAALKPQANYIIVSPQVAEAIENLDIRRHRRKKLKAIFKSQNEKTSE